MQRQAVDLKRARRKRKPAYQAESGVESAPPASVPTSAQATHHEWRGRPSARAQALVREQLRHGPRPGSSVMAAAEVAAIPERTLIAAASALGVRTQRGQWWIPS